MRTVEVLNEGTNEWESTEWSALVSGTRIRIFEEDSSPVYDGTGLTEFITVSDAYTTTYSGEGDVWTVRVADPTDRIIYE